MSEKISISLSNKSVSDDSEFDNALPFVKENIHNDDTPDEQPEDSRKVTRKLDLIILPLLCGIYFFQFLDKSLLNYAAAMGIKNILLVMNLLIYQLFSMLLIYLVNQLLLICYKDSHLVKL